MKRAIALIAAACMASPALASPEAVASFFFGLIIGNQTRPVVVQQPVYVPGPVIVQSPPVIVHQPPVVVHRPHYPRLVIDMNGPFQCTPGLAPHYLEQLDFRGNVVRSFHACQ